MLCNYGGAHHALTVTNQAHRVARSLSFDPYSL